MNKIALAILLALISCSRSANRQNEPNEQGRAVKKADTLKINTTASYTASAVYIDIDSDSLLLDEKDFGNQVSFFRTNGKRINEKTVGFDDCASKYTQFEIRNERLTIRKSDCADYGFGNGQYLTRGDSLLTARKYEATWDVTSQEFKLDLSEQIYQFKNGRLVLRERHRSVDDWVDLDLSDLPFSSSSIAGNREYKTLMKELTQFWSE